MCFTTEIFISRIRDCRKDFSVLSQSSSYSIVCRLRTHQRDGRVTVENRAGATSKYRFLMSLLQLHGCARARVNTRTRISHKSPSPSGFSSHALLPVNVPFAIVRSLEIAIIYGKAFISCCSNAYLARNKLLSSSPPPPTPPPPSASAVNHFFFTGEIRFACIRVVSPARIKFDDGSRVSLESSRPEVDRVNQL